MDNLTAYLELLVSLRGDLAAHLNYMGVEASADEPLKTLVPKILQIPQGDPSKEVFSAQMSAFDVAYDFFSTGETASLDGICSITLYNLVTALTVSITGSGLSALTVSASGWTVTRTSSSITLTRQVSCKADAEAALRTVRFSGDDATEINANISVKATFRSGATAAASGSTALKYSYQTTWDILQNAFGYTWRQLEADSITWRKLEALGKPKTS